MAPSLKLAMRSFWSDPYLWLHLAGLAAFPLFAEVCLVGFAMGDPFLPVWLELLFVAVAGAVPILWMQWQQPFYIFSLVAVSLKPEFLTDDQRRLLTLFRLPRGRVLAVFVALVLVILLRQLYELAPIATSAVSVLPASHLLGLLLAGAAFLACNLFVQVPISVASVMFASESAFAATLPCSLETVRRRFTLIGLPLNQILPPLIPNAKPAPVRVVPAPVAEAIAPTQPISTTEPLANDLWADTSESINVASVTNDVEALTADAVETIRPMDLPDVDA